MSFGKLLDVFFDRVDPTTLNRQGNDRGTQYRSAIYTHDLQQQADAQQKIAEVNEQLQQVRGFCWYWDHGTAWHSMACMDALSAGLLSTAQSGLQSWDLRQRSQVCYSQGFLASLVLQMRRW